MEQGAQRVRNPDGSPRFRTAFYVEFDPYAQAVLRTRIKAGDLDDAPIWDDVQTFNGRPWQSGDAMTPTNQTRLAEIRRDPCNIGVIDINFLLSLLSQETKRADEAEARTWEEAAKEVQKLPGWTPQQAALLYGKAAAVRRGREGKI